MKFERLRLSGFKTFVDPAEIVIAPGLTGIVGPNGCGKSNLVEAMRWVMGETSSKSLRGGGMDDVIFGGSGNRPERNQAEVSIRISEPPGDLTGHLAGADSIEISRRIVREQGSTFRMNGREMRARDVQIFFADAASGARSPSMVRQGQISEIIAAKPQHRRRILEDAAGVAGLHARRHEAELRLKAAEENLTRAEDILGQLDRQIGDLRRQAKQAERYKAIQSEIRALELAGLAQSLNSARAEVERATLAHENAVRAIAGSMADQGETERARAVAEHELEGHRARAQEAATALQALRVARETLDGEAKLVETRLAELARRRLELARDFENAEQLLRDAEEAKARLVAEADALRGQEGSLSTSLGACISERAAAEAARSSVEAALLAAQAAHGERMAEQRAAEARARDTAQRAERLATEAKAAESALQAALAASPELDRISGLQAKHEAFISELEAALAAADRAEAATREARQAEQSLRPQLAEAERAAQRLETEARTIRKMVDHAEPGLWTRAIDKISADPGFEAALGAALGEDLEAGLEGGAPRLWGGNAAASGSALPDGATPLSAHVRAPEALSARLAQIGVVARADGARLQGVLQQGQRLVSREGDLWRWDGFIAKAEAPSAAARRLAERNRLESIEAEAAAAKARRDTAREAMDRAIRALKAAQESEQQARDLARRLQTARDMASQEMQREQRGHEETRLRIEGLKLRASALSADLMEAEARRSEAQQALAALPEVASGAPEITALNAALLAARGEEQRLRQDEATLSARHASTTARITAIATDIAAWETRSARAMSTLADHRERVARLEGESQRISEQPALLAQRRRTLSAEIEAAETRHRDTSDALSTAETGFRQCDEAARAALHALAAAREASARAESALAHAEEKRAAVILAIETTLEAPIETLEARLLANPPVTITDPAEIERRLLDLKHDRDRMGAVNLRADLELEGIEGDKTRLVRERDEFTLAIGKFRRAIETLNSEGRTRLRAAFEVVNGHFKTLFERLFGGGSAELQLVEADDPLEAGLEIIAKPPGKKPQLLSLLSGGEQALTATALIFAVFRTNPSPICVLDEVDAPLDDANVERLCDLLVDMTRETATRFLVITHNPLSMARMDRLYGVTMVERGVSQLVSVDLAAAEKLAEAS